ncbi:hypothetical protein OBBRIDRAFT_70229 [Obba rivulosa]|uniref:Zn(2)-C6 fungal-type domain-containing protein n=1 Tax=Obba rivulosa TaxID=1052685 RepID=A0A8E2AV42_9APHY|nr:hypothetical protein OBBRIDRAFT_70229 [Obba rivulosa]
MRLTSHLRHCCLQQSKLEIASMQDTHISATPNHSRSVLNVLLSAEAQLIFQEGQLTDHIANVTAHDPRMHQPSSHGQLQPQKPMMHFSTFVPEGSSIIAEHSNTALIGPAGLAALQASQPTGPVATPYYGQPYEVYTTNHAMYGVSYGGQMPQHPPRGQLLQQAHIWHSLVPTPEGLGAVQPSSPTNAGMHQQHLGLASGLGMQVPTGPRWMPPLAAPVPNVITQGYQAMGRGNSVSAAVPAVPPANTVMLPQPDGASGSADTDLVGDDPQGRKRTKAVHQEHEQSPDSQHGESKADTGSSTEASKSNTSPKHIHRPVKIIPKACVSCRDQKHRCDTNGVICIPCWRKGAQCQFTEGGKQPPADKSIVACDKCRSSKCKCNPVWTLALNGAFCFECFKRNRACEWFEPPRLNMANPTFLMFDGSRIVRMRLVTEEVVWSPA